jgi:dCTP diphosphatase
VDIPEFAERLRVFTAERDWEQFHDPKNLAMALAAEAGELLEVFQWMTTDEVRAGLSVERQQAAEEELADVMIYLIRLADVLGVDLDRAVGGKILRNAEKYPVERARGNATKYDRRDT